MVRQDERGIIFLYTELLYVYRNLPRLLKAHFNQLRPIPKHF